jgi:sterol 3beta-glucosyltransferase
MIEEWFKGILCGLKDADLIVLSISSIIAGLSCIEKNPNTKAVGVFTFPAIRTVEFSPPALGGKSESVFNWINSFKWKMLEYGASSMYTDTINQLRANNDLPPIKLNYDQMIRSVFKKPILTATIYSKCLISRPADWRENEFMVGPIIPEEGDNDGFEPPNDLLEFLNKWNEEKLIYVGIGSMMSIMYGMNEQLEFLTNIQTAMENNNCKAIISLTGFQHTDNNRFSNTDNIFYLRASIPHTWLFPKMSAAIHHGGAGTTHTALRYGLPTLILPFGADQPFNGDRVFINKLGPRPIPARQTNVRNLTNGIHDLINNYTVYRNNALKSGELIKAEDGLGHCIQLIEKELAA